MRRYHTTIAPAKSTQWPHRVLCVDALACQTESWHDYTQQGPDLFEWFAQYLVRDGGEYCYHNQWSGAGSVDFWRRINGICERGQNLLIVSAHTSAVWAMLELWQRLESGELLLAPPDFDYENPLQYAVAKLRAGHTGDERVWSTRQLQEVVARDCGYLCLTGPPLIARLELRDSACWLTWIDLANYGITVEQGVERGSATAYWLARLWQRLLKAVDEFGLGGFRPTVGGLAYGTFSAKHYAGQSVAETDGRVLSTESKCVIGGRAESYYIGTVQSTATYLDIRSAYCWCCRVCAVPRRCISVVDCDSRDCPVETQCLAQSIATVSLSTGRPLFPLRLPDRTIWPVGEFTTTLAGPELLAAYNGGHITAWRRRDSV